MTKFYYSIMKIRDGEREYYSRSAFRASSFESAEVIADKYAEAFWSNGYKENKHEEGYYHLGGEVHVKVDSMQEISETDYNVLSKYL